MNDFEMNPQEMVDTIMKKIKEARDSMTRFNLVILGKTGVGKSTLINNIFSEPIADVGIGKPVTSQIRQYERDGYPLRVFDTPGLELSGDNAVDQLLADIRETVSAGLRSGRPEDAIHCIWYCVSASSHRFEDAEKAFITKLSEEIECRLPIIVVLTQSFSKNDAQTLKSVIEKENLPVTQVVPILAGDYEIDEEYVAKAYGLDRLIDVTYGVRPDAVKNTLAAIQKVNVRMKQKKAHVIVATSAAAAAATGAIPIPFSDAALLVPEQIGMLASITAAFGLPVEKSVITAVVSSTIGSAGATVLGKSIVAGIFKLIPGAGSVVGGAISGSVAAAITAALGEAYTGILTLICTGEMKSEELETEKGRKLIRKMFRDKLKLKRGSDGEPEIKASGKKASGKAPGKKK